jgi:hypothetical protein
VMVNGTCGGQMLRDTLFSYYCNMQKPCHNCDVCCLHVLEAQLHKVPQLNSMANSCCRADNIVHANFNESCSLDSVLVCLSTAASAVCKHGTYVDANGDCGTCPPGWVSTAAAAAQCTRCPAPLVAAEDQASCICPGGMKLSCKTNKCFCPIGSYKDAESDFACKVCPSGTTTTIINSLTCIGEVAKPVHLQCISQACTAVAGIAACM